jgi:hypothetical protein
MDTNEPMTPLSPAAQAVLDATGRKTWYRNNDIAGALRAAADQVVPKDDDPSSEWTTKDEIRYNFLAIAADLEGAN